MADMCGSQAAAMEKESLEVVYDEEV